MPTVASAVAMDVEPFVVGVYLMLMGFSLGSSGWGEGVLLTVMGVRLSRTRAKSSVPIAAMRAIAT